MEKLIFTYFLQDESGNIKIGKSNNPEKRFSIHQVGNASKLTLILYIIGDIEKQLHQKFDFHRIRNSEWFKPNKELNRYIEKRIDGFEHIKEIRRFYDSKIEEKEIWREATMKHRKEIKMKERKRSQEKKDQKIVLLERYIKSLKNPFFRTFYPIRCVDMEGRLLNH